MSEFDDFDDDEGEGFFGLVGGIWAEADRRRSSLAEQYGEELGGLARQHSTVWSGVARRRVARGQDDT